MRDLVIKSHCWYAYTRRNLLGNSAIYFFTAKNHN